jgi:predicted  nucleic acid-binding Zn-ribbon protein
MTDPIQNDIPFLQGEVRTASKRFEAARTELKLAEDSHERALLRLKRAVLWDRQAKATAEARHVELELAKLEKELGRPR